MKLLKLINHENVSDEEADTYESREAVRAVNKRGREDFKKFICLTVSTCQVDTVRQYINSATHFLL